MEHYSDKFGTTLKVGDKVIYPVLNKQGQLYKFESGKILSIKEGGGIYSKRFLISPSMELVSQSYIIKYDYPAQTAPKQTRKEELYDAMLGYLVELINKNDLVATLLNLGFTKSELEEEGILEEEE